MVYRIHFTVEDLARTRVAEEPRPLFELDRAARALQERSQSARMDAWRQRAYGRLSTQERMVLSLIPPIGWSLSLFQGEVGSVTELLERVRAIPSDDFNADVADIAERQPMPSWARYLGDDATLRTRFIDGMAGLHAALLEPYEARLTELFMEDRAVRMRQLVNGGIERLFVGLNSGWTQWKPPVLEVRMANGVDYDLHLQGRGLLLMPSMFGTRTLIVAEAEPQPILSYPACHDQPLRRLTTFAPEASAVSALLGKTRAVVLNAIAEHPGCSTKELAAFAGIAPASASEHATILRHAGLISTSRYRNAAVHRATELGIALLNRS